MKNIKNNNNIMQPLWGVGGGEGGGRGERGGWEDRGRDLNYKRKAKKFTTALLFHLIKPV